MSGGVQSGVKRPIFPTLGGDPNSQRTLASLNEVVSALLNSGAVLGRVPPGEVLRPKSGKLSLAWGIQNRVDVGVSSGVAQLPAIRPELIGVPLYLNKITPTGTVTVKASGKATDRTSDPLVDGSASITRTSVGLTVFMTDGQNWYSGARDGEDGGSSSTVATGVFPPAAAFRLPNTFNPRGLWYFDQDLRDSSGNGFDLQVEAGAQHYAPIFPGVMGGVLGGASGTFCRLICTGVASSTMLGITGDISVEMIVTQDERPSPVLAGPWVSYAGAGGLEVDNALWSYFTNINNGPEWYQEYNASVPSTLGLTGQVSPPVASRPILHGARRASGIIQFFQDGKPYGTLTATGLTLPTGGSASEFRVGGSQAGTQAPRFLCSSLKVVPTGLNNAAFLADYNASLGLYYGART